MAFLETWAARLLTTRGLEATPLFAAKITTVCIYCPLVILIKDQFLNEHLTHASIKLLRVAG